MPPNKLKKKLKSGETVFGTWSSSASPNIVNAIGTSGVDFIIIDFEHSSASLETAENMVRAAQVAGCMPIIRSKDDSEANILLCLEIGCQTIMIPHVENPETASRVVNACKYHPDGNRGMGPYSRHHDYCHDDLQATMAFTNQETLVGVLIEGVEGIGKIKQIAKTPNLDLVYMGIYDISQSVGVPGQLEHPKVVDALKNYADIIRECGKAAGSYAPDIRYAEMLMRAGYQFIAYFNDAAAIRSHYFDFLNRTKKIRL